MAEHERDDLRVARGANRYPRDIAVAPTKRGETACVQQRDVHRAGRMEQCVAVGEGEAGNTDETRIRGAVVRLETLADEQFVAARKRECSFESRTARRDVGRIVRAGDALRAGTLQPAAAIATVEGSGW